MTVLDPVYEAHVALLAQLSHSSISTLGVAADAIHWPTPPDDRTWPYILLDCLDAPELDRTFGGPTWTGQVWSITAVTVEDAPAASALAAAIDARIDSQSLTIPGYRHLCSLRRRAKQPMPVLGDDGVMRYHAGGEYTIGVGVSP
jgi:hypothetical protein